MHNSKFMKANAILLAAMMVTMPPAGNIVYAEEGEGVHFPAFYSADLVIPEEDDEIVEEKVAALVKGMTIEEKFTFLGGNGMGTRADAGTLPGVPRFGVPEMRMYDGPAGLYWLNDSTDPPIEELLAATWDEEMAWNYGNMVSQEGKAIGAGFMLSAQLDIQRTPQFSRTKDQMGEDPYLLSTLADDLVAGMQSEGGVAVLKHYVGYTEGSNNDVISEQALHEVYMPGFETAVKKGNALGIMSSYNQINGTYASANKYTQLDVLRDMWGYKYFTITDWGGNHEFTMNKGTDIEMPALTGNSLARIQSRVALQEERDAKGEQPSGGGFGFVAEQDAALESFSQEEADAMIDTALTRVLRAYGKAGYLTLVEVGEDGLPLEEVGRTATIPYQPKEDSDAQLAAIYDASNATIQTIAEQGAVLLKNEGNVLPLTADDSVAVIGLTGSSLAAGTGGERSYGSVGAMVAPCKALADILGQEKVTAEVYSDIIGTTIPNENLYTSADGDEHGALRTYGTAPMSSSTALQGASMFGSNISERAMEGHEIGELAGIDEVIDFTVGTRDGKPNTTYKYANADGDVPEGFAYTDLPAYTWETWIEAPEDGEYVISAQSIGSTTKVYIYDTDGETEIARPDPTGSTRQGAQWYSSIVCTPTGMNIANATLNLTAGQRYKVIIQSSYSVEDKDMQVNLSWITPSQIQANVDNAIEAAKNNNKVIVFVYTTGANGMDLQISAEQEQMVNTIAEAAHEAGNQVAVVLHNTTATVMENWIDNVDGLLDAFFPGQKGGEAIANLLTGVVNPSGKLAFTIPKTNSDTLITLNDQAAATYQVRANGAGGVVTTNYYEGINTGYKFFDYYGIEPQFDFGYGLSYTTFEYGEPTIEKNPAEGESIGYDVTFTITNTGEVAGSETAQIYLGQAEVPAGIQSSKIALAAFQKVKDLAPGETREVTIHVGERQLSYWNANQTELNVREDGTSDKWTVATGTRSFYVAASADQLLYDVPVDVQE